MLDKMKNLVRTQSVCVLATVSGNQPHCSLMSYAADADCREMYMVTSKNTKKYRNLKNNSAVSLLVDTRAEAGVNNRHQAQALTVNGIFEEVEDQKKRDMVKARLLDRHPHLKILADDPEAGFFIVRIKSMQLLEGVAAASFVTVD